MMREQQKEEDSGHFDFESLLNANKWVGHGAEAAAAGMPKIVAKPPHELLQRPLATGETLVQNVGAFDAVRHQRRLVALSEGSSSRILELAGPMPRVGPAPQSIASSLGARRSSAAPSSSLPPSSSSPLRASAKTAPAASPSSRSRRVIMESEDEEDALQAPEVPPPPPPPPQLPPPQPPQLPLQQAQTSTKVPGREKESKNKWLCICRDPDLPRPQGRTWHDSHCTRSKWARDISIPFTPAEGTRVTMLPTAGDAAGDIYIQLRGKWVGE